MRRGTSDIGQTLWLGRSPGLDTVARLFGFTANSDNPATSCVDVAKGSDYEIMGMDAPAGVETPLWAAERRELWQAAQVASADMLPPLGAATGEIGSLSASYESGTSGPATVSTGTGDNGGVSHESYQFASKMGLPEAFLAIEGKQWRAELAGLKSGTPAFSNASLSRRVDHDFASLQIQVSLQPNTETVFSCSTRHPSQCRHLSA